MFVLKEVINLRLCWKSIWLSSEPLYFGESVRCWSVIEESPCYVLYRYSKTIQKILLDKVSVGKILFLAPSKLPLPENCY